MESFVDEWLKAWSDKDTQKLLDFYADEFLYLDPGTRGKITSKEQFTKYLDKLFSAFPKWEWKRVELFENALKWQATFYGKEKPVTVDGLDILIIENNKIVRNEVFFDRSVLFATN